MSENDKLEKRKRRTRSICILITVLFITVMLIMPLLSIIASSLKEGFSFYIKSITTPYVLSALKVTIIATVAAVVINTLFGIIAAWLLTRVYRKQYKNSLCDTGSCACYNICYISICIKRDNTSA